jgi:hypothetical protein
MTTEALRATHSLQLVLKYIIATVSQFDDFHETINIALDLERGLLSNPPGFYSLWVALVWALTKVFMEIVEKIQKRMAAALSPAMILCRVLALLKRRGFFYWFSIAILFWTGVTLGSEANQAGNMSFESFLIALIGVSKYWHEM